jgi:putative oxidoreductase
MSTSEVGMGAPASVQRILGLGLRVAAVLAFLPPLLTRLAIGHAFYLTGRGKLANAEGIVKFFTDLGIPFPAANAAFVSRLEYFGGMLLIAGLLTRVVALLLSGTMVVALITADRADFLAALAGTIDKAPVDVTPFAYLLLLLWLVIFGPGAVSLDALLKRWLLPKTADAPPPSAVAA